MEKSIEVKNIICVNCPLGCRLEVSQDGDNIIVHGNKCPKGEEYGIEEIKSPKRILTGIIRTNSELNPYISVKSIKPIKREKIQKILNTIYQMKVKLPVKSGEQLLADCDNEGTDIIATRTLLE